MRDKLMQTIPPRGMTISTIYKALGIDPTEETHRSEVWKVSAALASLVRDRWLSLDTSGSERVYYKY